MNKNFHRVIFNAVRGLRVVVQETARSVGQGRCDGTFSSTSSRGAASAFVAVLASLTAVAAAAQIVADPNVPGRQRPTVLVAPNGVPLVNIQSPSAAGVSRNTYSRFDVGSQGVILNNSRPNTQSQLGGTVAGNPWLATGPARVILNEVNSSNPSYLNGPVEIAGQRAEFILANPSGISVNGSTFINASAITLTTGAPQFGASGSLENYLVRGGRIGISGAGLDASSADSLAVLSRAFELSGALHAKDLKVIAGANQVSADLSGITTIRGSDGAPTYAIDVAQLGGMYAAHIFLVVNEFGVGARNAGVIQTSSGPALLTGEVGKLTLRADGILENSGLIQLASDGSIDAAGLVNSGMLRSAGNLQVTTRGDLVNAAGTIEARRIELASATGDIDNRGGTIRQTSAVGLAIAAPRLSNTDGGVIGAEPVATSTSPSTDASGDTGSGGAGSATSPGTDTPTGTGGGAGTSTGTSTRTSTTATSTPIPLTPGTLTAARTLQNDGGRIYTGGAITLQAPRVNNAGGSLGVADMAVSAPTFSNARGTLNVANTFTASVGTLDNTSGAIHAGRIAITTTGDLNNQDGTLASEGDTVLQVGGDLANTNTGLLRAGGDSTITVAGTFIHDGKLTSAGHTIVTAGSLRAGTASVLGAGIRSDGTLGTAGDLRITTTDSLAATGINLAAGDLALEGSSIDLAASRTRAGDIAITSTQGDVTTRGAAVTTPGMLTVTAAGSLDNDVGTLRADRGLSLNAAGAIANAQGAIEVSGLGGTGDPASTLTLQSARLDNTDGRIVNAGGGATTLAAAVIVNGAATTTTTTTPLPQTGLIAGNGTLAIHAATLDNQPRGTIVSGAAMTLDVTGPLDNRGRIATTNGSGGDLRITAATLSNTTGTLSSDRDLSLTLPGDYSNDTLLHAGRDLSLDIGGRLTNTATGTLEAVRTLRIDAANLDNAGEIAGDTVAIAADNVTNTGAGAITGGDVTINARTLDNSGAQALIGATRSVSLWLTDSLTNRNGATVYSAGDIQIAANGERDADGILANHTASILNTAATIEAAGHIEIAVDTLFNERPDVGVQQVQTLDETHGMTMPGWWHNSDGNGAWYNVNATNYTSYEVYYVAPADILESTTYLTPDGYKVERLVLRTHANDSVFFSARAGADGAYGHRERLTASDGTVVLYALGRQDGASNPDQVPGLDSNVATGVWQGEEAVAAWDATPPAFDPAYGRCSTDCVRLYTQPGYSDPTATIIRDTQQSRGPNTALSEIARIAHTVATDDQLVPGAGTPGRIVAGGDIRVDFTRSLTNSYGDILAGGRAELIGAKGSAVLNEATTLYRRYQFDGTRVYADGVTAAYTMPDQSVAIGSIGGTISGAQGVTIKAAHVRNVDTAAGSAANIVERVQLASGGTPAVPQVGGSAGPAGPTTSDGQPMRLPQGGLFRLQPAATSTYLYETRAEFTSYRAWLSSDYLLRNLGLDPNATQKRLGDGFYEQRLIHEQIAQLTGRRYLAGYADDEAQYLALLKAGVSVAEQYGLRPGIALTAAQMAALTSDIVWLETQVVTLADGSTQQVLVPKVYLAQVGANALRPDGALITGDDVRIEGDSVVNRGGTLGDGATKRLVVIATGDILNQGGTLQGLDIGMKAGGKVRNESLALTQGWAQGNDTTGAGGSITSLSNTATIRAVRDLSINAEGDLTDVAGRIAAGRDASLKAGSDVHFETLDTGSRDHLQVGAASVDRQSNTANVGRLDAGRDLGVTAGRDLVLVGTQATAGRDASLGAGRHISLEAAGSSQSSDLRNDPEGSSYRQTRSQTSVQGASIEAGRNLLAHAGTAESGDLSVIGSRMKAGETVVLQASHDLVVADAGQTASRDDYAHASSSNLLSKRSSTDHETASSDVAVGGRIGGKNVLLSADNDVRITGSSVSAQDQLVLSAGRDIQVQSAEDRYSQGSQHAESRSGFSASLAGGLSRDQRAASQSQTGQSTVQIGSVLSGGNVSIDAGRDAQIIASAVVADKNIAVTAGRNIDVLAATDTQRSASSSAQSGRSVGLVSGLVPRQTMYGTLDASASGTGETRTAVTSLLSANGGKLTMVAGLDPQYQGTGQGNITTQGADLLAKDAVKLSGNAVKLDAATSGGDSTYHAQSRSVTVGAQLAGNVGSQVTRAYDMAQASRNETDSRLQGAQQLKAGYDAYKLATSGALGAGIADAGAAGTQGDPNGAAGGAFGVSANVSSSKSSMDSAERFTQQRGTNIQAGSIGITARETDIDMRGAKLQARDIALDAQRNINLGAAVNTAETHSNSSASSVGAGVTAGIGSQNGISFQLSAGSSKGRADGTETRYDNTLLAATDTLTIKSGGDTNLIGAQLAAKQVKAAIGGNLHIESLQDRTDYESRQSSSGVDLSVCVPPICYGQVVTASASYARQGVDHSYQSAQGQSGIVAGDGGFDIVVKGNTDLKGGAITSTAAPDRNSFTTASLTTSDLVNRQRTDASSESASLSYGSDWSNAASNAAKSVTNTALSNLNSGKGLPGDKNETSQTVSVISPANVKITGTGDAVTDAKSAENVATLTSRDATTANGALVNNLTLQQAQDIPRQLQAAQAHQQAARLVGSVVDNAIGDVSAKLGWEDGSAQKIALHGLAGIVQAKIGDGSALAGAAVGMANEALLPVMAEYLESQGIHRYNANGSTNETFSALLTAGSTLLGAAVGAAAGDAGLGGAVANNATVNNRLLHENEKAKIKQLAGGDPVLEQQLTDAACFMVQCSAGKAVADPAKADAQSIEQAVALNANGEYTRALSLLKNAQTSELFNYTEADQRLDALNALDPRNVGGLNAQEQLAKDQNLQACRGATSCVEDVNRRYDRQVSDRAEAVLTTINAINAYSQCAAGDVSCVSGSLVQMKAVQADLKARGVKLEESERIGLNSYIASAEATLGNGFEALSAAAMGAAGIKGSEAGNATSKQGGAATSVGAKGGMQFGALDDAVFAQVPAKSTKTFSLDGKKIYSELAGTSIKTVDDLTRAISNGLIKPSQLPVDYVMIDGQMIIANTRTTTALTNAGVPKSEWYGVNKTGQTAYTDPAKGSVTFDELVRDQLNSNYGGSVGNARKN